MRVPVDRPGDVELRGRWDSYLKGAWVEGWDCSITPAARFDSETGEFAFADLVDRSRGKGVRWWLRLDTQYDRDVHLRYDGSRRYHPDFVVLDESGTHWLVETKDDRSATTDSEVATKRRAGFEWAGRLVDEVVTYGPWRYLFVTEVGD